MGIELILTYVLVLISSIIVGMAIGLLPVLPMYFGPFLLYYVYQGLPPEFLVIYWIGVNIGSQFFGSVSTITTQIPGESSALIYLNDIQKFSLQEKNELLFKTSMGSLYSGIISLLIVYFFVEFVPYSSLQFLTSVKFQIVLYTFAIASFVYFDKVITTLLLISLGILLGPRNNYVLPDIWFSAQTLFQGTTMFIMVMGTLIIPEILSHNEVAKNVNESYTPIKNKSEFNVRRRLKDIIIGFFCGLVPGPSASLSSTLAYRLNDKDVKDKVVSAETANNSAVISMLLPLFLIGLPITEGAIIFTNILDAKMIDIIDVIKGTSVFGVSNILFITASTLALTIIFYLLSLKFIDKYIKLILGLQNKFKLFLIALIAVLVSIDIWTAEVTVINYFVLLSFFTIIGVILNRYKINPIPFMFSVLLGDKIVWVYIQCYNIYF